MTNAEITVPPAPPDVEPLRPWGAWFWPIAIITTVLDLWSKAAVFARYQVGDSFSWWGEPTFNRGVAWGIGDGHPGIVTALTLGLIPLLTWVWWTQFRAGGRAANLAFGAIIGGAVGNCWDRVMMSAVGPAGGYAGVRDFIRIDLHPIGIPYIWPNFNVADAGISLGFMILVSLVLFKPAPRTAMANR